MLALHGIEPSLAAGHSLGEWSAHVAAGTISFADAVRSVKARGTAMQLAVPAGQGAMAAMLSLDSGAGGRGLRGSRRGNRPDRRRRQLSTRPARP